MINNIRRAFPAIAKRKRAKKGFTLIECLTRRCPKAALPIVNRPGN